MNSSTVTAAPGDEAPRRSPSGSPAAIVRASMLPTRLAGLVLAVTGKCRLWDSERSDVARELCAHFLDGLDAGATPDELAASFGDPLRAARLITASRRRLRPRWWRSARAVLRVTGATLLLCMTLYAFLLARFFLVSPNIARNFASELNAPVRQSAPGDRAWPLYIRAKLEFGPVVDLAGPISGNEPSRPGDENWDRFAEWLDAHAPAFETLRAAAGKPTLGYLYRSSIDPDLARVMEALSPRYTYDPALEHDPDNPLMFGILLPHLGEMRRFARLLRSDALLAASRGDRARFDADIDAMLGIAEHALDDRFLISQTVGVAVADLAVSVVLEEATRPDFLTSDGLRDLAHALAAFGGGGHIPIDASLERLFIEDVLQRYFSDDGHGDGHFIGASAQTAQLYTEWGVAKPRAYPLMRAVQPVRSVMMPSRAQIRDKADHFVAAAAADDVLPPWRHDERASDRLYEEVMEEGVYAVVPFLRSLAGPEVQGPIASLSASRDMFLSRRDAALAVIAAEALRRATGRWPAALSDLVPAYLPAVPLDPFDGRPMRYLAPRAEGEPPILYSIGVDGVDDNARLPLTEAGRFGVHNLYWQRSFRSGETLDPDQQQRLDAVRGDWILWPVPPPVTPGK